MKNLLEYTLLASLVCVTMVCAGCPKLKLKENFSTERFMGIWYEIQSEPNIFQTVKSCPQSLYTLEGEEIKVITKGLDGSGSPTSTKSTLRIVDPKIPAHMVTDFVPGVSPPFDIVDTDYNTFACAHSCVSFVGMKTEFVFIFSRNRTLNPESIQHCRTIFQSYGIDTSVLVNIKQTKCHDKFEL